jgi:hypothetical protein
MDCEQAGVRQVRHRWRRSVALGAQVVERQHAHRLHDVADAQLVHPRIIHLPPSIRPALAHDRRARALTSMATLCGPATGKLTLRSASMRVSPAPPSPPAGPSSAASPRTALLSMATGAAAAASGPLASMGEPASEASTEARRFGRAVRSSAAGAGTA